MPLSEHEQRQLQQIEQALYRNDPKFGRRMRASDLRVHYERKLLQALLGVVIGAGLFAAGAITHRVYLEAAGVVIVLLSLVWAVVSWRRYVARVGPARSGAETKTALGRRCSSPRAWSVKVIRAELSSAASKAEQCPGQPGEPDVEAAPEFGRAGGRPVRRPLLLRRAHRAGQQRAPSATRRRSRS